MIANNGTRWNRSKNSCSTRNANRNWNTADKVGEDEDASDDLKTNGEGKASNIKQQCRSPCKERQKSDKHRRGKLSKRDVHGNSTSGQADTFSDDAKDRMTAEIKNVDGDSVDIPRSRRIKSARHGKYRSMNPQDTAGNDEGIQYNEYTQQTC